MHTGPWKQHIQHHYQQWAPSPIFFPDFPLFYCYFSFGKAHISLFGSAHWTLKTSPNIITNHPYFFSDFSPILLLFLHLVQLYLLYMEMCNRPWKQHHTPFFFLFFLLFYLFINVCILFICKCNFFYGNVHLTLTWWGCCDGMKLLLKWKIKWFSAGMKEISFSCRRDLEWNRCHEWLKIHFIHSW